jgi:hypothetical protein
MMRLQAWLLLANFAIVGLLPLIWDHSLLVYSYPFLQAGFLLLLAAHEMQNKMCLMAVLDARRRPFFLNFPVLRGSPTPDGLPAGDDISIGMNLDVILRARSEPLDDERAVLTLTYSPAEGKEMERAFLVRPDVASAIVLRVTRDKS